MRNEVTALAATIELLFMRKPNETHAHYQQSCAINQSDWIKIQNKTKRHLTDNQQSL